MINKIVKLSVLALVSAATGAGIYAVTLKDCHKVEVVGGVSKTTCSQKFSCNPNPPWKAGCP